MNHMQKSLILSGCLLTLCSSGTPQPALAQRSAQVQFKSGNYGTMLSGTISGREYFNYTHSARKGQKLFAEPTVSGSKGEAIRVYRMGNDKHAGKTVGFNLDLSIQ